MRQLRSALDIFREQGALSLFGSAKRFLRERTQEWVKKRRDRQLVPAYHMISHRYRYGHAAPQPDQLLRIDPSDVDYLLTPHFWDRVCIYSTYIEDGEWDTNHTDRDVVVSGRHEGFSVPCLVRFDNYKLYTCAKEHFREGVPWEHTELYDFLLENRDSYWTKYNTKEKIEQTLQYIEELYERISNDGYLSQTEIWNRHDQPRPAGDIPPNYHEVAINIGRDGEMIFDDGRHRFVIAKIIGISSIPVRVLVRHEQWQSLRCEINDATSVSELSDRAKRHLDHPDVQTLR